MATTVLKKGQRVSGDVLAKVSQEMKKAYDKGKSIREIAGAHGRSYGFTHRVLKDAGVKLRGRGGATRSKSQK